MEQNFVGLKERAGEVIYIVPLEDVAEQPGGRVWRKGREETGQLQHWEAQWQQFLKGLDSPQAGLGKEPRPWEDAKAFLASFEQVAQACQWPKEEWVVQLLPALSGEAQQAFGSLEDRDRKDYGKVKVAILRREANRMETLRQHFRQFRSREVEDPRGIYSQLQELCRRWLRPEKHSKEQILELLILEQFLAILPPELQNWIRAGGPENCTQAAALAEDFLLSQQTVAETSKRQGVHRSHLGLQEILLDPVEMPSHKKAEEQAEIGLPGSGTQLCPRSSSLLPPERQERIGAGQRKRSFPAGAHRSGALAVKNPGGGHMEQALPPAPSRPGARSSQALTTLKEAGVSLKRKQQQQHLAQDPGQRTTFWQVLPDTNGKADSLGVLLVPRADHPVHLEKEDDVSLWFPEERGTFRGQDSGDEKGSRFKAENPSRGGNKRGGPEKTQGDVLVTPEIQVEICESEGKRRKKSPQGQTESRGLSEGLGAVCSRSHPKHPRYGQGDECSSCEENVDLDEHQRTSTGEKSYQCQTQGSFPEGVNPMRNQSGHTGERKHSCPESGKSSTPKTLMRHLEIHCEQTTFTCPVCGKSMKWKQDLNRHLRLHTGEKPFKCPECGISFSRTDGLLKHRKSHGRKMPYECPQCGKNFSNRRLMVKHQRKHK